MSVPRFHNGRNSDSSFCAEPLNFAPYPLLKINIFAWSSAKSVRTFAGYVAERDSRDSRKIDERAGVGDGGDRSQRQLRRPKSRIRSGNPARRTPECLIDSDEDSGEVMRRDVVSGLRPRTGWVGRTELARDHVTQAAGVEQALS